MPVDRREFLIGLAAPAPGKRLEPDGTAFVWRHEGETIACGFEAPAEGWLAVGFNVVRDLRGTRFVIAATPPPRIEERLARVPDHIPVATPMLISAKVARSGHRTSLSFTWPHEIAGGMSLAPGTHAHVMLAWSRSVDFAHHSAWRRHFDVVL